MTKTRGCFVSSFPPLGYLVIVGKPGRSFTRVTASFELRISNFGGKGRRWRFRIQMECGLALTLEVSAYVQPLGIALPKIR
jgi:hypothetical protein